MYSNFFCCFAFRLAKSVLRLHAHHEPPHGIACEALLRSQQAVEAQQVVCSSWEVRHVLCLRELLGEAAADCPRRLHGHASICKNEQINATTFLLAASMGQHTKLRIVSTSALGPATNDTNGGAPAPAPARVLAFRCAANTRSRSMLDTRAKRGNGADTNKQLVALQLWQEARHMKPPSLLTVLTRQATVTYGYAYVQLGCTAQVRTGSRHVHLQRHVWPAVTVQQTCVPRSTVAIMVCAQCVSMPSCSLTARRAPFRTHSLQSVLRHTAHAAPSQQHRRRSTAVRPTAALQIDWSDPDTLVGLLGAVLGLGLGIGVSIMLARASCA